MPTELLTNSIPPSQAAAERDTLTADHRPINAIFIVGLPSQLGLANSAAFLADDVSQSAPPPLQPVPVTQVSRHRRSEACPPRPSTVSGRRSRVDGSSPVNLTLFRGQPAPSDEPAAHRLFLRGPQLCGRQTGPPRARSGLPRNKHVPRGPAQRRMNGGHSQDATGARQRENMIV